MVEIIFDPYIFEPYVLEPFTDFYQFEYKERLKGEIIARFRMGEQERQIKYTYDLRDMQMSYQRDIADLNRSLYDVLEDLE